ncbi:MAG: hypothetical protein JO046_25175 [Solirubrobacterales bacterium]|nr:hypothetical protein [Solirubrobacterales bacterium]
MGRAADMSLAGKLQLKPGRSTAFVNRPDGLEFDMGNEHPAAGALERADAVIVFCRDRQELERLSDQFVPQAARDALTWVAYPKAGELGTERNRGVLAELVKVRGVRPVRQVAVDETWSALRLRPA